MYENIFIAQTCARYSQLVGLRVQLKQEAKFSLEVKPKTYSLRGQLPAPTWYDVSSSSNNTNIPNTFSTVWNKRPPEIGTTGADSPIKTEQYHTIDKKIKSCNEDVSENIILHSLTLQCPSDELSVRPAGSTQSDINPHIEFQIQQRSSLPTRTVVSVRSVNSINRRKEFIQELTETVQGWDKDIKEVEACLNKLPDDSGLAWLRVEAKAEIVKLNRRHHNATLKLDTAIRELKLMCQRVRIQ